MRRNSRTKELIVVTGGAGYLGSVLVPKLLEAGYSVRVFDKLFFGEKPIKRLFKHPRFQLIKGDIVSFESNKELLKGVDSVIHLAGLANDPSCDLDPGLSLEINYRSTVRFAKVCKAQGIRRFIFASSCSVYGAGGNNLLTEESDMNPVSLYAKTKIMAENEIRELSSRNFAPVFLRQATLFGLSPRMRFDLAINLMTKFAVLKNKIFVMGGVAVASILAYT